MAQEAPWKEIDVRPKALLALVVAGTLSVLTLSTASAQVAPPTVVKTPDEPDPEDIQPASMGETLMRKGRVVDGEGTVWGLG